MIKALKQTINVLVILFQSQTYGSMFPEPALIIENNLKLVEIELPASLPSFKVRVRGNKLLSQNSIDRLRKWSPASDIQQKGGQLDFDHFI